MKEAIKRSFINMIPLSVLAVISSVVCAIYYKDGLNRSVMRDDILPIRRDYLYMSTPLHQN